jgi:NAD(P)-dependent dehydrogenase (short-subunit alcohol dehydrogenase family)
VGVYDVDVTRATELAERLGNGSLGGYLDVTEPASWAAALAGFVDAAGGRLDVMVNNAGIMTTGTFDSIALATQLKMVDVNLKGVIAGCHTAYPYLRKTPGARLINLASASAIYGQPDLAVYSATKFAVRGLSEALQIEWAPHGIAVSAIWPLFVNTALVTNTKRVASMDAFGVRLTPADVAAVVWRAARATKPWGKTHWPVGLQTRLSMLGITFSLPSVTRFVVAKASGR